MNSGIQQLPVVVRAQELAEVMNRHDEVLVLDVRTPAEFESAHIPGSYNVPLDLLPEHDEELAAAIGAPVVLVCRSGARARQAEQTLRTSPVELPRLHVLDGGVGAWEAAGLPLNRGAARWSMERQVRGVAGGIALAGALGGLLLWRPLAAIAAGIGGGLLVSALTDTCTMAKILGKLPYNQGASCDIDRVITDLSQRPRRPVAVAAD